MKLRYKILSVIMLSFVVFISVWGTRTVSVYSEFGSRGEEVKKIQRALINEGLYNYKIDGIYGLRTENAVINYQKRYKLRVDGKAGSQTLKKMGISSSPSTSKNELNLLSRAISGEARGESYEGQVAVGAVILNRVRHPSFPNTIAGVIYQPGAFSIVNDGQINDPPKESAVRAAKDALNGYDPSWGAIYYYNPKKTSNKFMHSRPVIRVIGNHRFCN